MKVLIAIDSFKDAADSFTVCEAVKKGWIKSSPHDEVSCFPLADGGEGLIDILKPYLDTIPPHKLFEYSIVRQKEIEDELKMVETENKRRIKELFNNKKDV